MARTIAPVTRIIRFCEAPILIDPELMRRVLDGAETPSEEPVR